MKRINIIRIVCFSVVVFGIILYHFSSQSVCKGDALCLNGKVEKIIDGDTLDVDGYTIRLSLVDSPERNEEGYYEAKSFVEKLCPINSSVVVDQDDDQPYDRYDRVIAVVYCGEKNLNAELLDNGLVTIDTRFCSKSEFRNEDWTEGFC